MKFQEKLVKLRKLKKITQDEFACAVGVSRQAVYKFFFKSHFVFSFVNIFNFII